MYETSTQSSRRINQERRRRDSTAWGRRTGAATTVSTGARPRHSGRGGGYKGRGRGDARTHPGGLTFQTLQNTAIDNPVVPIDWLGPEPCSRPTSKRRRSASPQGAPWHVSYR